MATLTLGGKVDRLAVRLVAGQDEIFVLEGLEIDEVTPAAWDPTVPITLTIGSDDYLAQIDGTYLRWQLPAAILDTYGAGTAASLSYIRDGQRRFWFKGGVSR